MKEQKIDFYKTDSLKSYNLDQTLRYQLAMLNNLDHITKRHSDNVGNLCLRLCQYLNLNDDYSIFVATCGYLHDIGKLGIPKEIIEKDDILTKEEYEIMKTHTTIGYDICMKDPNLRPYSEGPLYHHEKLNGSGYPKGLTKKDIPFSAQIVTVADEYDALVTKRHYTTHVNISNTLKDMIKDARPESYKTIVALNSLSENTKLGKLNPKVLKVLFDVVIEDTYYEIESTRKYKEYLKDNIKRLELINKYKIKHDSSEKLSKKAYYTEGMKMLFREGETIDNYLTVLQEYKDSLNDKELRIKDLENEIKIIKKLKI